MFANSAIKMTAELGSVLHITDIAGLKDVKSKGFGEEDYYIGFCQDWRAADAGQCVEELASL